MRGDDKQQSHLFSYVSPEKRVPADHPLRPIRALTDRVLTELSPQFDRMYSAIGRPSIPPEHLLRALLLQVFYTVRSERQLMEQLNYNLLFRWFVGLNVDDDVWSPTTFSKNRDRLLEGEIAELFFEKVLGLAEEHDLVSKEHFTVDGTLIEAWASMKSFVRKEQIAAEQKAAESADDNKDEPKDTSPAPKNPTVDFKGEKRSNETHASRTDPDARLFRKGDGQASKLCYMGHVLMENRNGLVVDARLTHASGTAEREAALEMVDGLGGSRRVTVGADKGYDTKQFVADLRERNATPHVAQNASGRSSAIDGRTTRHEGYGQSQRKRKRVEEIFGWMKTVGVLRKTRHRGVDRVGWMFQFAAAAFNLTRIRTLVADV